MKVSRRMFLLLAGGAVVIAGGVVVVVSRWPGTDRFVRRLQSLEGWGRTPLARLRRHYAWLPVEPSAFDRYLEDYARIFGQFGRFSAPDMEFFTRFLLSTDFFMAGGGYQRSGAPVSYMQFYEPSASPCYNPLAGTPFDDPDGSPS